MSIHSSAIIDPSAQIGADVTIGPYSVIGPDCIIGDGTQIASHVVVEQYTTVGKNCRIASGAVLGGLPQDLRFKGERSYVKIGDNTMVRECATINRASGEEQTTVVGNGCMIMAYSHLGHNCQLGNEVILANAVQLGGHVEVGDFAFVGGTGSYHQFVRIGKLAIVSGFSASRQDIPPFSMSAGCPAIISGINKIGLKRRGYDLHARTQLKKAFQLLWFSDLNTSQAIETIRADIQANPHVDELLAFVESSKRGINRPAKARRDASLLNDQTHPSEMLAEMV